VAHHINQKLHVAALKGIGRCPLPAKGSLHLLELPLLAIARQAIALIGALRCFGFVIFVGHDVRQRSLSTPDSFELENGTALY
jgi:hypothetical protein